MDVNGDDEAAKKDKTSAGELEGPDRARYVRALLNDLRALERMVDEDMFEKNVAMIGAEQEMFLVDRAFNASPTALQVIEKVADKHFTTELGLFNLEMNADPQPLAGSGFSKLEAQLHELYAKVKGACSEMGVKPVLSGILPTLQRTDLSLDNMVPNPRYLTLNRVMRQAKGEDYDISIKGLDELNVKSESLMFEACNASFQVHLQALEPKDFGHFYDVAQLVLAPTMALGTNSPLLLGQRLWAETRITLFEQSCDIRTRDLHARQDVPRVGFGTQWHTDGGVVGIFKENVTRYRPLVGMSGEEDSSGILAKGGVPELRALRLHGGTVYRWNRACYGISPSGKPHLRIELRILPSGPSIIDEVANAAFWIGLMRELTETVEDLPARMEFENAKQNFYNASREGLSARFVWLDGQDVIAQPFILDHLLPLAERGLARGGVDDAEAKKYLSVIDKRVRSLHTGTRWALRSLQDMKPRGRGNRGEELAALVAATIARQETARPVSEWERARIDELPARKTGWERVSQYMQTDLLTVHPSDPVELAADIMTWERIRHLPVEDENGKFLGVVTSRAVLRHYARRLGLPTESSSMLPRSDSSTSLIAEIVRTTGTSSGTGSSPPPGVTTVGDVMRADLVTIPPDTSTLEAIKLMRTHRIGCLPVVKDGRIVAMVMEEDFMGIAADLLEEKIQSQ
ncbi:MAG: CBS domain-containing protein [Labilithrix sp.]|nr:CBS domain-containing protein [Labilithrix sp.]MCW5814930.1 CBS domain-containing protein [Labilithrix sp.]